MIFTEASRGASEKERVKSQSEQNPPMFFSVPQILLCDTSMDLFWRCKSIDVSFDNIASLVRILGTCIGFDLCKFLA